MACQGRNTRRENSEGKRYKCGRRLMKEMDGEASGLERKRNGGKGELRERQVRRGKEREIKGRVTTVEVLMDGVE